MTLNHSQTLSESHGIDDSHALTLSPPRRGESVSESHAPTMTAGEVLEARLCTPQCLLAVATESTGCGCRCNARWHGVLIGAMVPGSLTAWHEHANYGPTELDQDIPAVRGGAAFNRAYGIARSYRHTFAAVEGRGKAWRLTVDLETERFDAELTEAAAAKWETLLVALIHAGRVRSGSGGRSLLCAYGVKTKVEAQTLGMLALELFEGDHWGGTDRCLAALAADGFVRPAEAVSA